MFTKRQKEILDYIKKYKIKYHYAPSLEEIKKHLKLASVSTVHFHIKKLQNAGHLHKEQNQPRSISTITDTETIEIPLLGTITAGQPIEAIEMPGETIPVIKNDIGKFGQYYALRVEGNSMIDDGIFDGDIVVVREQKTAENGQTVIAIIDDNEATLKKIYQEKNRFRLQPANISLFPIYRKEVEIRGVVVKIIRSLMDITEKEKNHSTELTRRIDYSWDFKNEKTKSHTHGIHSYPAMFIPQVARRLLLSYSKPNDTICDIFCGSGTALVESKLLNRNAYGIDLNPLAIFLARAKTTRINPTTLQRTYLKIINRIQKIKNNNLEIPQFKNLNFWFKDKIIIELAKIKKVIKEIKNEQIKNFFMVAFSETVRRVSNTKNGEFKLFRIKTDKLEKHNPNVFEEFRKKAEFNINKMIDYYKDANSKVYTKIIYGDSSQDNGIDQNSIDYIITSPPYGDSRTTVAYGQFSRLSSQWIDIFENPDEASGVDKELLGGNTIQELKHNLNSNRLKESLNDIANKDTKRAKEVLSFYLGLNKCLQQAYRILKPKKYFCLVIGNRMVKQIRIPTDFIITELGEEIGFTCEDVIVRNIPGKRMPIKNSPTNIAGEIEETINKESIVVLRKD
ncbi:MAG: transcriptional repressor LexA [bacterium]